MSDGRKKKKKARKLSVRLGTKEVEKIEKMVARGEYLSCEDFVRQAVRWYLAKKEGLAEVGKKR